MEGRRENNGNVSRPPRQDLVQKERRQFMSPKPRALYAGPGTCSCALAQHPHRSVESMHVHVMPTFDHLKVLGKSFPLLTAIQVIEHKAFATGGSFLVVPFQRKEGSHQQAW